MPRIVRMPVLASSFDFYSFCLFLLRWILDIIPNKHFYCITLIIINPRIRDSGMVKET